jgi:hypothetical protein
MSILLACLAYRNRAFEKGIEFPEMYEIHYQKIMKKIIFVCFQDLTNKCSRCIYESRRAISDKDRLGKA